MGAYAICAIKMLSLPSNRKASLGETFGVPSSETVASQQSTLHSMALAISLVIICVFSLRQLLFVRVDHFRVVSWILLKPPGGVDL